MFVEQEASVRHEIIDGKKVPVITPRVEITLKNLETGKEYNSDAEAMADVQNTETSTKAEHISRSVHIAVEGLDLGAATNLF
tara:strand:+ start:255 stop:500 length:246 start_codon:yes stop_codon:yes gene_type:complete